MQTALSIINIILIIVFLLIIKDYLPSYMKRKGENLATKEDIAEITHKIEEVKHQYSLIIEQFKSRNQLRMAALDKRLEIHQRAYVLWRNLVTNTHDGDKIGNITYECQEWWFENCLYLEAEPREAFVDAYKAARRHLELMGMATLNKITTKALEENYEKIMKAGKAIEEAVALPPITGLDKEIITKN
jgi:hypothetical protein